MMKINIKISLANKKRKLIFLMIKMSFPMIQFFRNMKKYLMEIEFAKA